MSPEGSITGKRIKLAVIVGVPLLFAVACSSNVLTCAEGNTSDACRVSADRRSDLTTGSIRPQQSNGATVATAQPQISKPATVASSPQRQTYRTASRWQTERRKPIRVTSHRRPATCEVTGSIPRKASYAAAALRPSGASRRSARPIEHVVVPGETLYSLSRRYGASVVEIASYNVIDDATRLQSGATILIPPS